MLKQQAGQDNTWWKESVIYQIYPRSFKDSNNDGIGDLPGIIEKLPYLQSLGVTMPWISPFYLSPMADNGYDIADYYAVNPEFGEMRDVDTLIDKAAALVSPGRAMARRLEGPSEVAPPPLVDLAKKVELLESEIDDLHRSVEALQEENQFMQKLLSEAPRRAELPKGPA